MQEEGERLRELADFLRTRRERLSPEDVGLPRGSRRRTPGLRREEVAQLVGVGATWYTWLEQARDVRASVELLENLSRVLRLNGEERDHLFLLARGQPAPDPPPLSETVSPELARLVDNLGTNPAYVTGPRWDLLAWNRAATAIYADFGEIPPGERNLLRYGFTDAELREKLVDWEWNARCWLGQFRASLARYPGEPGFSRLVDELRRASPEFRRWWEDHDVSGRMQGRKEFDHPVVGRLVFEHATFRVDEAPDLNLVLYSPAPEADTAEKLRSLVSAAPKDGRDAV